MKRRMITKTDLLLILPLLLAALLAVLFLAKGGSGARRAVVTYNGETALEIDLTGQVCSETIAGKQYSGTGGAWDFAYGAFHAKNGRGIIALQSTAKSGTISRIVPRLTAGNIVTIPRNIVDIVVTEYGVARLRGKSVRQRVEELIAVAHPDFRQELRDQARKLEIW